MKTFTISDQDEQKINEWLDDHNKTCIYYDDGSKAEHPCGAIGGRLTYDFTPTGLGSIIHVTCMCTEALDLTEYTNW